MSVINKNENMFSALSKSDEDFPTLAMSAKKSKKSKKQSRKDLITIPVGHTPYLVERQKQWFSDRESSYNRRTEAFEKLQDKEGMEKRLYRTKMCNSVIGNIPKKCPHGDECRYAHNVSQLAISECFFGIDCTYVYSYQGKWYNNKESNKKCFHCHPGEEKTDYMIRCGIPYPKETETESSPKEVSEKKPLGWKCEEKHYNFSVPKKKLDLTPVVKIPSPIPENLLQGDETEYGPASYLKDCKDCKEEENESIVLSVPKAIADVALKIALEQGKTNIQIEII